MHSDKIEPVEKISSSSILHNLNPQQRDAVTAIKGPVLVLAGAGSGKTRVLAYRIAYLLQEGNVSPYEILAMTFTNKAAGEMKERVQHFVPLNHNLWIGTFHSIFSKILRLEADKIGYSSDFIIYDSDDQERLVKSIMKGMMISEEQFGAKSILNAISRAKNNLNGPESFSRMQENPFEQVVSRVYSEYQRQLRINGAFDFDDLITLPIQLFTSHPDILKKYQSRFKYILVDEYQDTNRAQYLLLYHLAKDHRNLCVVGDDDQSIYRWRGADIRNILEFDKDFPDSQIFRLEQNYRSTQNILNGATSVVEKNKGRKAKKLWSDKEQGEKIECFEVASERDEAQSVIEKIKYELLRKKRTFCEFAILYRTNAQSRALEDGLRRSGFSYVIVGGVRFYERKEIKDILAYLKLIANPKDSVSLKRIINFPLRGIGEGTLIRLETWAAVNNFMLFDAIEQVEQISDIQSRLKVNINHFYTLIKKYINLKKKISLNELVHTLVDEMGLLKIYKEDSTVEGQSRAQNVREFLTAVDEYVSSVQEPILNGFLEEVSLVTDIDRWDNKTNAITLMTLHCAKGLEFPVVFITGLEEGLFPIARSINQTEELEEERRLFYVGLTRAKEKVYLFHARKRNLFIEGASSLPSRFLDELEPSFLERNYLSYQKFYEPFGAHFIREDPENYSDPQPDYESFSQEDIRLHPGLWVEHNQYGQGQIKYVEGTGEKQRVIVQFEGNVKKKFVVKYARFTLL
ncbi:UvrD-helicase domain-containing protein [bacterium]|nr:UvrD-helicase domain-containing protein [bacterium]RQV95308.1 MAG: hypothetical protein EH221_06620 [bacterium]